MVLKLANFGSETGTVQRWQLTKTNAITALGASTTATHKSRIRWRRKASRCMWCTRILKPATSPHGAPTPNASGTAYTARMAPKNDWAQKVLAVIQSGNAQAAMAQIKVAPSVRDIQACAN